MRVIGIVAVPRGVEPEHIRLQWIGLQLPCVSEHDMCFYKEVQDGVCGVRVQEALPVLLAQEKITAYEFWKKSQRDVIFFQKEEYVVIM